MRIYSTLLIAAALIGGGVLAGCGSSSSDSSTTAISKQEFLKKGNAICAKGNKQLNSLANQTFTGKKPTQAQLDAYAKSAVPLIQSQVDGIKALGTPSGADSQVNAILDAAQKGIDTVKSDPSTLEASNKAGPFAQANKLASDYGLNACGG